MVTVADLIEALKEYNLDAEVHVIIGNYPQPFSLFYGSSEGCTKENCESVAIYPEEAGNQSETTG